MEITFAPFDAFFLVCPLFQQGGSVVRQIDSVRRLPDKVT